MFKSFWSFYNKNDFFLWKNSHCSWKHEKQEPVAEHLLKYHATFLKSRKYSMVLTVPYRFHLHLIHHRNVPHCRNGPNNDNIDHLQGNIPLMQKVKSGFRFSGLWTYQIDTWRNQYFGNFYCKELCGHNRYHYKHDSPIF